MALTDYQRITIMAMAIANAKEPRRPSAALASGHHESKEETVAAWTKALEGFGSRDNYNRCLMVALDAVKRIQSLPNTAPEFERQAAVHQAIRDSEENWLRTGDVPGITQEKFRAKMAIVNEYHAAGRPTLKPSRR